MILEPLVVCVEHFPFKSNAFIGSIIMNAQVSLRSPEVQVSIVT